MDSITQAALGAAIGHVMLSKQSGFRGAVAGACVATVPDLDVVFYLFYSKFEMLSIHRGYSHSIFVNTVFSFLIAWILSRTKWYTSASYWRLLVFSWLALITHLLLDACTAYGTQVLLPFSDLRVSFDTINVVDPAYTVPLIVGLVWALFSGRRGQLKNEPVVIGLLVSSLYLMSTFFVKSYVSDTLKTELDMARTPYDGTFVSPVGMGSGRWYQVAHNKDSLYIRPYNLFDDRVDSFVSFAVHPELLDRYDPHMAERLVWFARDNYTLEQRGDTLRMFNLQVDMRGIVRKDGYMAPTVGYFELFHDPLGNTIMSSGQIEVE